VTTSGQPPRPNPRPAPGDGPQGSPSRPAHLEVLAIAWNFGWPVTAGVLLGYWIDQASGASPIFTLLLGLGAFAASIARLVQLSSRDSRERREGDDGQHPEKR